MNYLYLFFLLFCIVGIYLSYLYGRKTKKFSITEYFLLLSSPILCCLSLTYFYGIKILYLFFASSIVGFILEYSIGLAYYKTLNKRLWTYDKYNVGGFTSLLTFPMWGVAGVVFWLLSHSLGL